MSTTSGEPITIALTFVPTSAGTPSTVVVSATSTTSWAEVTPLLPDGLGETTWYAGPEAVAPDAVVGADPLIHAAELTDRPHQAPRRPLLELTVAEGPDCGQVRPVTGRTVIGRASGCEVPVRDLSLSRAHARIDLSHGHAVVADLGSTNGTSVDSNRVGRDPEELKVGQRLRTGATVSRLTGVTTPPPLPVRGGRRALSRPPRQVPEPVPTELTSPRPPQAFEHSIPWLMMLLPVPAAVILALLLRSPMFLAFAVFSPLMMLGQYLHDRIGGRRSRRAQHAEFRTRTAELEQAVTELLDRELADRRRLSPDLADLAAQVRAGRCWARRPGDADHLLCRLGTGRVTAGVTVRTPDGERETFDLEQAPVTLDLAAHRVSGLTGEDDVVDRAVDSLVGQLVAAHSPTLLRIVVVSRRSASAGRWHWIAWLPHVRPDTTGTPLVLDPDDDEEQLRDVVGAWARERETGPRLLTETPAVHTVVLLDGAGLTHRPLLHALVQHGGAHGVAVVAAAPSEDGLPSDCTATVSLDRLSGGRLLVADEVRPFAPDLPTSTWRAHLAASLASTVDTTPGAQGGEPPAQVRLLDLLEEPVTAEAVGARWRQRPCCHEILLGLGAEGAVTLDLVRDGPHALVGGTTGSGKSELLQTLITSLALANRPDEVVFLLVDYKGGAAFKDCVDLPHTVGLVTDLDPFLTRRALSSLDAEIRRRERLLAAIGAKDLDDYQDQAGTSDPPIPRLVLVVDEFRVLAEELPDFIDGIVRLAAVGRSLGIHVVLATQRPAGVISADIRANVNLRIALRVRDASDSDDIIESPAAAQISAHTPGRALVRTGATPPVAVQSARVSGSATTAAAVRILPVDPRTARVIGARAEEAPRGTGDLRALVDAMRAAAENHAIPQVPSPWLSPLPPTVARARCADATRALDGAAVPEGVPLAPLGLIDLPVEQRQVPAGWALGSGHLAIVGGPRSGRSTALRTIVAGLADRWGADDVHVHAIDTAGGLGALAALPHVGAVISSAESTQVTRMVSWLAKECTRRQHQLASGDHADLVEQRRSPGADGPLPYDVLLLDGWDTFQTEYELGDGAVIDTVLQVLRDGPAVGLSVVLTGGRAVLSGRVASAVQHRLCLRMADEMDLVLAGLRPAQVPKDMPPGRALLLPDGDELQIATPGDDAGGAAQSDAVRAVAAAAEPAIRRPPKRFSAMPERVQLDDLPAPDTHTDGALLVGVGGEEAEPVWWDPDPVQGTVALIAGPPGSGRTTALRTLAAQLAARGPVLWRSCAGAPPDLSDGVRAVGADEADDAWCCLGEGFGTLVIDDAELLADPYDELAAAHLARCRPGSGALLLAGSTQDLISSYRGVGYELRRRQSGLLLQPARGDGDLLGTQVPHTGRSVPGRGVLVQRTRGTEIQVAEPPSGRKVRKLLAAGRHTEKDVG